MIAARWRVRKIGPVPSLLLSLQMDRIARLR